MTKDHYKGWNRFLAYCKRQSYFRRRFDKIPRSEVFAVEAADILKCQPSLIRRAIGKKELSARHVGRYFLINKHDLWIFFCLAGHWNGKKITLKSAVS